MKNVALGVDMAARSFVPALWLDSRRVVAHESLPNDGRGFRALSHWLKVHHVGPIEVGIECTNVYGLGLAHWLHQHGHVVYLLNPAQTAAYARAIGQRNKTDPADARTIATFVALHREKLTRWQPPAPEQQTLRELTRGRQQLLDLRQQVQNQLRTAGPVIAPHLQRTVDQLKIQITKLEQHIRAHLRAHPALEEQVRRLCTIKGVGPTTAATAVAELPPINAQSDPRAIAAWVGLVPRRWQSGATELPARLSRRGNNFLRQALYMPALVAKRYNPLLKDFAHRLKLSGKSNGAILGAIAHKMLRIMVGLLKNQQDFDPNWSFSES
jgi:transposase